MYPHTERQIDIHAQQPRDERGDRHQNRDHRQPLDDVVDVVGNNRAERVHGRLEDIPINAAHLHRLPRLDEHVVVKILIIGIGLHGLHAGKPAVNGGIRA